MASRPLVPPLLQGKTLVLRDPRAIRALAHPARLAVLDELFDETVERTATELASAAGISASAMSYHLRALDRFGIIERAGSRSDGRDRPWRRVGSHLTLDSGQREGDSAATMAFVDQVLEQLRRRWEAAVQNPTQDLTSQISHDKLWLTDDERHELSDRLTDAVEKYLDRRRTGDRHSDAREVELAWFLLPVLPDQAGQ